jgi:hypothetical protein
MAGPVSWRLRDVADEMIELGAGIRLPHRGCRQCQHLFCNICMLARDIEKAKTFSRTFNG